MHMSKVSFTFKVHILIWKLALGKANDFLLQAAQVVVALQEDVEVQQQANHSFMDELIKMKQSTQGKQQMYTCYYVIKILFRIGNNSFDAGKWDKYSTFWA